MQTQEIFQSNQIHGYNMHIPKFLLTFFAIKPSIIKLQSKYNHSTMGKYLRIFILLKKSVYCFLLPHGMYYDSIQA
jgi:hypothetical protein